VDGVQSICWRVLASVVRLGDESGVDCVVFRRQSAQAPTACRKPLKCTPSSTRRQESYITQRGLLDEPNLRAHDANPRWLGGRRLYKEQDALHHSGVSASTAMCGTTLEHRNHRHGPPLLVEMSSHWAVCMTVKFAQNWKFCVEICRFLSAARQFSHRAADSELLARLLQRQRSGCGRRPFNTHSDTSSSSGYASPPALRLSVVAGRRVTTTAQRSASCRPSI